MHCDKKNTTKKHYEKPVVRLIKLAAEEVLALGCKTAPGAPGPVTQCTDGGCAISTGS